MRATHTYHTTDAYHSVGGCGPSRTTTPPAPHTLRQACYSVVVAANVSAYPILPPHIYSSLSHFSTQCIPCLNVHTLIHARMIPTWPLCLTPPTEKREGRISRTCATRLCMRSRICTCIELSADRGGYGHKFGGRSDVNRVETQ